PYAGATRVWSRARPPHLVWRHPHRLCFAGLLVDFLSPPFPTPVGQCGYPHLFPGALCVLKDSPKSGRPSGIRLTPKLVPECHPGPKLSLRPWDFRGSRRLAGSKLLVSTGAHVPGAQRFAFPGAVPSGDAGDARWTSVQVVRQKMVVARVRGGAVFD